MDTTKTCKPDIATKTLESIQFSIDRLITMHLDGRILEADFQRHYSDLLAEKEIEQTRLLVDPRPAQQLIEGGELDRAELRQLVLLIVYRMEAPITSTR